MAKIVSDIDAAQQKRILEILHQEIELFKNLSNTEIEEMMNILKFLQAKK